MTAGVMVSLRVTELWRKNNLMFFVMDEHTNECYFIAMEIAARVQIDATDSKTRRGREKETYLIFVRTNFSTEMEANLCGVR